MKLSLKRMFAAALVLACARGSVAQVEMADQILKEQATPYDVDAISFAGTDGEHSRLDIFLQRSFENISFVKAEGAYAGAHEITIALYDSVGALVAERMWTENLKAQTFEHSVSPRAVSLVQRSFEIPPGKYLIYTISTDVQTKIPWKVNKQIIVPGFGSRGISVSDIMLVSRITVVGEKKNIIPQVSPNVGLLNEPFHLFLEAYNFGMADTVLYLMSVYDQKNQTILQTETTGLLNPGRNAVFLKVDHTVLSIGDYTVHVQVFPVESLAGEKPVPAASTNRKFIVRWEGLPLSTKDLELAIDQLIYLAKTSELDHIRAGKTPDERQKRFVEFWKKRDPNPNTPRNEKMEEYYRKVEYANKHFKHYTEGWRTDMGMVYIMFGAPSSVDRYPFGINSKPHEVWAYYELNEEFVFVDESGFGDYRLITPIWNYTHRIKE